MNFKAKLILILLICPPALWGQISLEVKCEFKLRFPTQNSLIFPNLIVAKHGAKVYAFLQGKYVFQFDTMGEKLSSRKLEGFSRTRPNKTQPQQIIGPNLLLVDHIIRVSGGRLIICNSKGKAICKLHIGTSQDVLHAFQLAAGDSIWHLVDFDNAYEAKSSNSQLALPLTNAYDDEFTSGWLWPISPALMPYLSAVNWLPGRPCFALYQIDINRFCAQPKRRKSQSISNELIGAICYIGLRDSFLFHRQIDGLYSPWLNDPKIAWGSGSNAIYFTQVTSPRIEVYDTTGHFIRSFFKHGFREDSLFCFPLKAIRDFGLKIGQLDTVPQTGFRGCRLPSEYDQAQIDLVFNLGAIAYGRTIVDIQLGIIQRNHLLLRILSKPKPEQDSTWWAEKLRSSYLTQEQINALRARTLQVYDLAAEGRFVGEIEVPPLFRILEIDPQGMIWAVTGVDDKTVTVGRFRLVRE